jgi:hypothetical protein
MSFWTESQQGVTLSEEARRCIVHLVEVTCVHLPGLHEGLTPRVLSFAGHATIQRESVSLRTESVIVKPETQVLKSRQRSQCLGDTAEVTLAEEVGRCIVHLVEVPRVLVTEFQVVLRQCLRSYLTPPDLQTETSIYQ